MRNLARIVAAAVLAACAQLPALAQDCAGQQRIVIGFAPGGGADVLARVLAERLGARGGRVVLVENRVGASGNIASSYVAKAAPDSCTMMLTGNHHNLNTLIFSHPGYESRDFAPVIHLISAPSVIVANPQSGPASMQALVAQARANPGKLSYSTSGIGSPNHIGMELFLKAAGLQMVHVAYRGAAPALAEAVGGVVPLSVGSSAPVQPFVASGRLRALAVTTAKRSPSLPDVPSIAEAGYPEAASEVWNAILVPAATPLAVRERLNASFKAVLQEPAVRERLSVLGYEPVGTDVADAEALLQRDERVSRELQKNLHLKLD